MKCPRCLNTDESYFYKGSKGWYCRKCISFKRVMIEESMKEEKLAGIRDDADTYILKYPLTEKQMDICVRCIEALQTSDCLITAVCGAGKTEIMVGVIGWYLKRKKKVCFAIARRQVVLEVADRLQSYFRQASVVAVCGGHTAVTDGDLIVCTTHQLYRYSYAFDLLILDEPDAFPFKGDDVLHGIAETSVKGRKVYLTATPDEILQKRVKEGSLLELKLNQRPHGKPVPVPEIIISFSFLLPLILLCWLKKHQNHPCIVFVPSIQLASLLCSFIRFFFCCTYVTSKEEDRDERIENFRRKDRGVIVATTVLERGVTIPDADVCVYYADSSSFDKAALIQMAGRAGRNYLNPYGDVLFLCKEKSDLCTQCKEEIERANAEL